jgi:3-oxoacyl-[acyl-carrier-protein] synthase II
VTGIGLVSPLGNGTQLTWDRLVAGESGIGPLTRVDPETVPCKIAGEVRDFDPLDYIDKKDVKKTDRFVQYAIGASEMALADAGLSVDSSNDERFATVIGCGIGGLPLIESMHTVLMEKGPSRVSPFFIPGLIANMAAGRVSMRFGAKGPNTCPVTACTTGLHAIGDAFRLIEHGYSDYAFAGGTEGAVAPLAIAGFGAMRALSTGWNDEPKRASRPWDVGRDGFVLSEGAGIVILEELEAAEKRGARIYAEIIGYGMSGDAYHISAPHPEGEGSRRCMAAALADADLEPNQIDYINAHGTSTPLGDVAEVIGIKKVFGDHAYELAVSSTKSSTGHLLGAAGGLEAGILALSLHHQLLPATINLEEPGEGCDLDFVPNHARPQAFEYGMTNSFGFGGTNGSLIMRRHQG